MSITTANTQPQDDLVESTVPPSPLHPHPSPGRARRARTRLAPESNPFSADGSATSFSAYGAPRFCHPIMCRNWDSVPLHAQPPALPGRLRLVDSRLNSLRVAVDALAADDDVIEICNRSQFCGSDCCLRPLTRDSPAVTASPAPWASPYALRTMRTRRQQREPSPRDTFIPRTQSANSPHLRAPDASSAEFIWWAGMVSPGAPPQLEHVQLDTARPTQSERRHSSTAALSTRASAGESQAPVSTLPPPIERADSALPCVPASRDSHENTADAICARSSSMCEKGAHLEQTVEQAPGSSSMKASREEQDTTETKVGTVQTTPAERPVTPARTSEKIPSPSLQTQIRTPVSPTTPTGEPSHTRRRSLRARRMLPRSISPTTPVRGIPNFDTAVFSPPSRPATPSVASSTEVMQDTDVAPIAPTGGASSSRASESGKRITAPIARVSGEDRVEREALLRALGGNGGPRSADSVFCMGSGASTARGQRFTAATPARGADYADAVGVAVFLALLAILALLALQSLLS